MPNAAVQAAEELWVGAEHFEKIRSRLRVRVLVV